MNPFALLDKSYQLSIVSSYTVPDWVSSVSKGTTRFVKDIIGLGTFKHKDHNWVLRVTPDRLRVWAKNHRLMSQNGNQIPAYKNHDHNINLGFWPAVWIVDEGLSSERLVGAFDVEHPDHVKDIGTTLKEVSVCIEQNVVDGRRNQYGDAITHIAPCTEPVYTKQKNFEQIAAAAGSMSVLTLVKEFEIMDMKAFAKMLGLTIKDDNTDEEISSLIITELSNAKKLAASTAVELSSLKTKYEELVKTTETKNSQKTIPQEVTDLQVKLEASEKLVEASMATARTGYLTGVRAKVKELIENGQVTPAMVKSSILEDLKDEKLQLSQAGGNLELEALLKVWKVIPKGTFTGTGERVSGSMSLSQFENEDKEFSVSVDKCVKEELEMIGYGNEGK